MSKWKYLYSIPFQVRHIIAADYLKDHENIIEIGGYKTPISQFLKHNFKQVTSVDPLIEPCEKKGFLHAKQDYRLFDFGPFVETPYAFVILGMDLPFDFKLCCLFARACRVIIEFSPQHLPSQKIFEFLEANFKFQVDLKLHLDFSENDFSDLTDSFPVRPHRTFYVLSPPKNQDNFCFSSTYSPFVLTQFPLGAGKLHEELKSLSALKEELEELCSLFGKTMTFLKTLPSYSIY